MDLTGIFSDLSPQDQRTVLVVVLIVIAVLLIAFVSALIAALAQGREVAFWIFKLGARPAPAPKPEPDARAPLRSFVDYLRTQGIQERAALLDSAATEAMKQDPVAHNSPLKHGHPPVADREHWWGEHRVIMEHVAEKDFGFQNWERMLSDLGYEGGAPHDLKYRIHLKKQ